MNNRFVEAYGQTPIAEQEVGEMRMAQEMCAFLDSPLGYLFVRNQLSNSGTDLSVLNKLIGEARGGGLPFNVGQILNQPLSFELKGLLSIYSPGEARALFGEPLEPTIDEYTVMVDPELREHIEKRSMYLAVCEAADRVRRNLQRSYPDRYGVRYCVTKLPSPKAGYPDGDFFKVAAFQPYSPEDLVEHLGRNLPILYRTLLSTVQETANKR